MDSESKLIWEIFNSKVKYAPETEAGNPGITYKTQKFEVDGITYIIKLIEMNVGDWFGEDDSAKKLIEITFGRLNEKGEPQNSYTVKTTKNPIKVFSYVINFVRQYIETESPSMITFFAEHDYDLGDGVSDRDRLYNMFQQKLISSYPQYELMPEDILHELAEDGEYYDDQFNSWGLIDKQDLDRL